MKLLKKYGIHIFWGLLFIDCFLINFKSAYSNRVYTKPLLIITLATYFFVNTKRSKHWRSKSLVYVALLFSWLSDCNFLAQYFASNNDLIGFKADWFLYIGLVFLLLAFSTYALLFKRINGINIKDCQEAFLTFLPMLFISIFYYKTVSKEQDFDFFKPIVICALIILIFMMTYASNIYHDVKRRNLSMQFFIPGAIVLVITTGLILGYRLYLRDAEFLPAVIGLTTGFGQMLMIRGFTKYLKA